MLIIIFTKSDNGISERGSAFSRIRRASLPLENSSLEFPGVDTAMNRLAMTARNTNDFGSTSSESCHVLSLLSSLPRQNTEDAVNRDMLRSPTESRLFQEYRLRPHGTTTKEPPTTITPNTQVPSNYDYFTGSRGKELERTGEKGEWGANTSPVHPFCVHCHLAHTKHSRECCVTDASPDYHMTPSLHRPAASMDSSYPSEVLGSSWLDVILAAVPGSAEAVASYLRTLALVHPSAFAAIIESAVLGQHGGCRRIEGAADGRGGVRLNGDRNEFFVNSGDLSPANEETARRFVVCPMDDVVCAGDCFGSRRRFRSREELAENLNHHHHPCLSSRCLANGETAPSHDYRLLGARRQRSCPFSSSGQQHQQDHRSSVRSQTLGRYHPYEQTLSLPVLFPSSHIGPK